MNIATVQTGQMITATAVVDDTNGNLITPSTIVFRQRDPSDAISEDATVPAVSTGVYIKSYTLSQRGTYGFQIITTGPDSSEGFNATADWRYAP